MKYFRAFLCLSLCTVVLAGFGCAASAPPGPAVPTTPSAGLGVRKTATILVPQDEAAYVKAVDESGADPKSVAGFVFVKKEISYAGGTDERMAVAQAAASELHAGPDGSDTVDYFKVVGDTAYVQLAMDHDGWAGVSFALAKVHPLVERSLLQYPEIKHVAFSIAPGDSQENGGVSPTGR